MSIQALSSHTQYKFTYTVGYAYKYFTLFYKQTQHFVFIMHDEKDLVNI